MINLDKENKSPAVKSAALPLMEHFYTIQGEGYNTGKACYFLRLGGCDVGCVWCDVKDSWDASQHPLVGIGEMVKMVKDAKAEQVVITGGEPLMYDLTDLTSALRNESIKVFLETSGAYPLSGTWDWICVSPKKFKSPLPEMLNMADELKVIVFNKSDFSWAEQNSASLKPQSRRYLQPEYSVFEKIIPSIVDYVKANPEWQISLQTHKIIHVA